MYVPRLVHTHPLLATWPFQSYSAPHPPRSHRHLNGGMINGVIARAYARITERTPGCVRNVGMDKLNGPGGWLPIPYKPEGRLHVLPHGHDVLRQFVELFPCWGARRRDDLTSGVNPWNATQGIEQRVWTPFNRGE